MRILITGSKGLIGSALRNTLKMLGIDAIGIDIQFDADHPEHGNILDADLLGTLARQVDGIVHFAAVSRVIDGEKNPKLCWETNVEGTKNVVEAALQAENKPWVLYASSREVYGRQNGLPVKESAKLNPINIYGESKAEAENVIALAASKGLITSIVRFSNVFGSVHDYQTRVVPAFCLAAAQGGDIRVEGSSNVFDFTYIEDVVQGVLSMIYLISKKEDSLSPIHLTSGRGVTLEHIAQFAKNASDFSLQIHEEAPRSFDVSKFWGDTHRAEQVLHWRANVTIEQGMSRLINQYRLFLTNSANQYVTAS